MSSPRGRDCPNRRSRILASRAGGSCASPTVGASAADGHLTGYRTYHIIRRVGSSSPDSVTRFFFRKRPIQSLFIFPKKGHGAPRETKSITEFRNGDTPAAHRFLLPQKSPQMTISNWPGSRKNDEDFCPFYKTNL